MTVEEVLNAVAMEVAETRNAATNARVNRVSAIIQAHNAGFTDAAIASACGMDRSQVTRIITDRVGYRGGGRRRQD